MKVRPPLPRSLHHAINAGQFREDRNDSMRRARAEPPTGSHHDEMRSYHVLEARALNHTTIQCIRKARKAHALEMRVAKSYIRLGTIRA